jgi:hypothetical protein
MLSPVATVEFTPHLRSFFPDLPVQAHVEARTIAEVVRRLEERWPGFAFYVTDEVGRLRQHVAVWVDGRRVEDRNTLGDAVSPESTVHILQALSGG